MSTGVVEAQPAQHSSMRLKDKVALITGGAQGIGLAMAKLFSQEGAKLALYDLNEEQINQSIKSIGAENHAIALAGNVTKRDDCDNAVKKTIEKFGRIDILVNNAGITKDTLIVRMSDEQWDAVLDVNLKGVFYFCRAAAHPMMKQRGGRIINIASVVGQFGNPGQVNYAASKGGVIALTKTLAKELGSRNILVNAVAPGFVRTRLTEVLPEEVKKQFMSWTPQGRFGEPEEIAKVCLFLASDDASFVTGQVIGVNGGLYM